jgi:hypothetical protein
MAVIALAPLALTFVLTKQRMAAWYVLSDHLIMRALLVTLGIVVASTAVCLAARALGKPDIGAALHQWLGLPLAQQAGTLSRALLLSLGFLVGSSTLFLTVIKEDSGLPLLPSKDRLTNETQLRKSLVETVSAARAWPNGTIENRTLDDRTRELGKQIELAETAIAALKRLAPELGRPRLYAALVEELDALRAAVADVGADDAARNRYWGEDAPKHQGRAISDRRALVRRHAGLSVHA